MMENLCYYYRSVVDVLVNGAILFCVSVTSKSIPVSLLKR